MNIIKLNKGFERVTSFLEKIKYNIKIFIQRRKEKQHISEFQTVFI